MSVEANLVKKKQVLSGEEARSSIIVDASVSIKYFAQSFPGASPTDPVWLCSRQESIGSDYPYISNTITYPVGEDPVLAAPGVDGVNLAALFGDV